MKKILHTVLAVILISGYTTIADAATKKKKLTSPGLASVCANVTSVISKLFIYKSAAPVRSGGIGTPLIGFRIEPTLIMNKNVSGRGRAVIYDKNGNAIGSCPWATAHGHSGGRYRCTMNTRSLRNKAVKNTKSPAIYFKINKSTCVEVPEAGKCYGSVKGLCNRIIK